MGQSKKYIGSKIQISSMIEVTFPDEWYLYGAVNGFFTKAKPQCRSFPIQCMVRDIQDNKCFLVETPRGYSWVTLDVKNEGPWIVKHSDSNDKYSDIEICNNGFISGTVTKLIW